MHNLDGYYLHTLNQLTYLVMYIVHLVVSTVGSSIFLVRFSTVECIRWIFGLSFEDMVGVQQNTMKGEGKSSDNDKTHNKKPCLTIQKQAKRTKDNIVETTHLAMLHQGWLSNFYFNISFLCLNYDIQ